MYELSNPSEEGNEDNSSSNVNDDNMIDSKNGRWTKKEHRDFIDGLRLYGKDWNKVY